MKYGLYILTILLLFSAVYVKACRRAGVWLIKENEPVHADAIVILVGSIADRFCNLLIIIIKV